MRFVDLKVSEPPADLPVTVEEFVDHARLNGITVDRQPELLTRELTAATTRAEKFLRRSLLKQGLKALFVPDGLDCACAGMLRLPRGNVIDVVGVSSDGAPLPAEGWTANEWGVVTLQSPATGSLTVEWHSGYGETAADVPEEIREGILQYATTLYQDRSGARLWKWAASSGKNLPPGIEDIWRPFQIELGG